MTEKLKKLTVRQGEKAYELDGGSGSQVGPDTVDSAAIIDGSVQTGDLSEELKDGMVTEADRITPEDLANFQI